MSRYRREKKRGGDEGDRTVKLGVEVDTPTHSYIGVMISRGDNGKTVIAPDEARTMAVQIEDEDPATAVLLRKYADAAEFCVKKDGLRDKGTEVSVVPPKITGPHALGEWVGRYRNTLRGAYQEAVSHGLPFDVVVFVTPTTESLDAEPQPVDIKFLTPAEANELLAHVHMKPSRFENPPGAFYVLASRSEGRFKGTFQGILSVRDDVEVARPENN
jgi:hypothetical protein